MSATGCGHPVALGPEDVVTCGTRLSTAMLLPVLCPTCAGRAVLAAVGLPLSLTEYATLTEAVRTTPQAPDVAPGATCEGCREAPAVRTRPPLLCRSCEAEYMADMAANEDRHCDQARTGCFPPRYEDPGECRCSCGPCLTAFRRGADA